MKNWFKNNKTFQMTFKNGVTVSVWPDKVKGLMEVSAWDKDGYWITHYLIESFADLKHHLTADKVLDFMIKARDHIPF